MNDQQIRQTTARRISVVGITGRPAISTGRGSFYVVLLLFLLTSLPLSAQPVDTTQSPPVINADTVGMDSVIIRPTPGGPANQGTFDEPISYAADSVVYSLDRRKIYLYWNADVKKGTDRLRAAYIEVDLNNSELFAAARYDSLRDEWIGVPLLDYGEEQLSSLELKYNYKTRKGLSTAAEMAIEQGRLRADRFKVVSNNVLFLQGVEFTTCDAPQPHYYFKAEKAKLQDRSTIFADRVEMYIEDVPVIALPIGFFFAMNGGRHSGIILPDFNFSQQRGAELNGLGYYWAGNDYVDSRLTVDLSTQGGENINNWTRFRVRDIVNAADFQTKYSWSRTDPDEPLQFGFDGQTSLNFSLGTNTILAGNLHYATQNVIRRSETDVRRLSEDDISTQLINSNLSFSSQIQPFGIPIRYSVDYGNSRNIVTSEIPSESWTASITPPTYTPFSRSGPDWLQSLAIRFQPRYRQSYSRLDTIAGGGFRVNDTRRGIDLSPSISWYPKFSYFTFSPSFNPHASIFFRRRVKQNNRFGTVDTSYVNGIYIPFWYDAQASVSTNLYGIIQPRIFGLNAIRHRMAPSIGVYYRPDFSDPSFGHYDQYLNSAIGPTGEVVRYSIYEADLGMAPYPGAGKAVNLTFGIDNDLEAKIAQGDTLPDRKITLVNFGISGAYNVADTSTPFENFFLSARTNLGKVGSISGSAVLSPYHVDEVGREIDLGYSFPFVRVVNTSVTFSTSLSDQGFNDQRLIVLPDTLSLTRPGHRHSQRGFDADEFYGSEVRGNGRFRIPWELGLRGTYNITPKSNGTIDRTFSINTDINFSLTPTTRITASAGYEMIRGDISLPTVTLTKDLHDWDLSLQWSGYTQGIRLHIGFKPAFLSDVSQDFIF